MANRSLNPRELEKRITELEETGGGSGGSKIDDTKTETTSCWSSSKTSNTINSATNSIKNDTLGGMSLRVNENTPQYSTDGVNWVNFNNGGGGIPATPLFENVVFYEDGQTTGPQYFEKDETLPENGNYIIKAECEHGIGWCITNVNVLGSGSPDIPIEFILEDGSSTSGQIPITYEERDGYVGYEFGQGYCPCDNMIISAYQLQKEV